MRCWSGYLSEVRWRLFAYGHADATAISTPSFLASFISRLVLPFLYWLTEVFLEKRPLNRCSNRLDLIIISMKCHYRSLVRSHTLPVKHNHQCAALMTRYFQNLTLHLITLVLDMTMHLLPAFTPCSKSWLQQSVVLVAVKLQIKTAIHVYICFVGYVIVWNI